MGRNKKEQEGRTTFASFERGLYDHEEIHVKRAARGVSRRIDSADKNKEIFA